MKLNHKILILLWKEEHFIIKTKQVLITIGYFIKTVGFGLGSKNGRHKIRISSSLQERRSYFAAQNQP